MYAPFNRRKPIAVLAGRVASGRYEIAVRSLMSGPLALTLREVALPGHDGVAVAVANGPIACVLEGGERVRLLAGDGRGFAPAASSDVDADGSAIPLGDPGRSMYREWAWLRRPHEIEQIDSELRGLDGLPLCRTLAVGRPTPKAGVTEDQERGDRATAR